MSRVRTDCPECGEARLIRERFFPFTEERPAAEAVILARCGGCGLRRFVPAGTEPPPRARPRRVPRGLLREASVEGVRGLVVAPLGTELTGDESVARWSEWPRQGDLNLVHLWFSLEECADPKAVLETVKSRIKPGGQLKITTVNACALGGSFLGGAWPWYEPFRQRILLDPVNMANMLKRLGFRPGRLSFDLLSPVMRADARAG